MHSTVISRPKNVRPLFRYPSKLANPSSLTIMSTTLTIVLFLHISCSREIEQRSSWISSCGPIKTFAILSLKECQNLTCWRKNVLNCLNCYEWRYLLVYHWPVNHFSTAAWFPKEIVGHKEKHLGDSFRSLWNQTFPPTWKPSVHKGLSDTT